MNKLKCALSTSNEEQQTENIILITLTIRLNSWQDINK